MIALARPSSIFGSAEINWNDKALYSLLLVKDFASTQEFQVSDIPTSNSDIPAIIGTAVDKTGKFNIDNHFGTDYTKNSQMDRVLQYHITSHGNAAEWGNNTVKYPSGSVVSIQGDTYDRNNWKIQKFQ